MKQTNIYLCHSDPTNSQLSHLYYKSTKINTEVIERVFSPKYRYALECKAPLISMSIPISFSLAELTSTKAVFTADVLI